ncbi:MAG: L-2-amino-thiazoline-4-carboxylic acid hydrolase [Candidatus Eremiobacteraeota bacterium]|nr:L-2-amino-thiazoline-4-carboxylic acid hydrolase [Candidatus Eremiobacteraeota bacterium]
MNIDAAKKEIREAHKLRAVMYHYLLEEMERAFGAEEAREVFKKATFRKGRDVRKQYEDFLTRGDFHGLARHFVKASAAEGELFSPAIESADGEKAVLTMAGCPLVEAWKELGLAPPRIKVLCEVAAAIDYGTFESEKTSLSFSSRIGAGDPCCRLTVAKK